MNTMFKRSMVVLFSVISITQAEAKINAQDVGPWHITASMGWQSTPHGQAHQGNTALGRLSFDYMPIKHLGIELGVQSGNTMRFAAGQETVDTLGGVGIEGHIKPMIDVLVTIKSPNINSSIPLYASVKAGVAYRQLQMDRESINDLSQVRPEFQAAVGYRVNPRLDINLTYQYVSGGNPNICANQFTEQGQISNIPIQRAVLLGLTYTLG